MNFRYPIARCPKCDRPIVYSDNPKDKTDIIVRELRPGDHGKSFLCAKCKTMLAIIEKHKAVNCFDYTSF